MKLFNLKFLSKYSQENHSPASKEVSKGDVYVKNDKVPSTFVVDKLLDFSPAPIHVRLKEVGGNERTVTVALETLLNECFWHKQKAN